ncbi:DUF1801 domain-containing protein [Flavobacterium sp.]|uniref:YdeI/OmpD-associated family protein n=1 Tax=Flavobacterium sp. TaxID=239 RepID=UPI002635CE6D|nr:DUF1801 domain-containing protein [Flavobacterium sp.]MDG2432513.1 YdeI/OmpD-associated family protein [Flavobacterium sp.]
MNTGIEWFFEKPTKWKASYQELREILLGLKLTEEAKWGCPCYTFEKKNIVLIHGFKEYCALLFMKGVLMNDPQNILVQQTKNVQSARQIRFTTQEEIINLKSVIKSYITNAIEIEKSGVEVHMKKISDFEIPEEFQVALNEIINLKVAFNKLTTGRQKVYLLYFSSAKQSKTRDTRIQKSIPKILSGKGLDA